MLLLYVTLCCITNVRQQVTATQCLAFTQLTINGWKCLRLAGSITILKAKIAPNVKPQFSVQVRVS